MRLLSKCRVTEGHEATYPDPIVMRAGDTVDLGRRDDEFPGWVWGTGETGKSGWIPEAYLELAGTRATARRDYAATELSVEAGEEVTVHDEECGWAWVSNSVGERGWVPVAKLRTADDGSA